MSAISQLATQDVFAFGRIGYAGVTSPGEVAFMQILQGQSAVADFEAVFRQGNAQGKAYALVGLRHIAAPVFDKLLAEFRSENPSVESMSGCFGFSEPATKIIDHIMAGRYGPGRYGL